VETFPPAEPSHGQEPQPTDPPAQPTPTSGPQCIVQQSLNLRSGPVPCTIRDLLDGKRDGVDPLGYNPVGYPVARVQVNDTAHNKIGW